MMFVTPLFRSSPSRVHNSPTLSPRKWILLFARCGHLLSAFSLLDNHPNPSLAAYSLEWREWPKCGNFHLCNRAPKSGAYMLFKFYDASRILVMIKDFLGLPSFAPADWVAFSRSQLLVDRHRSCPTWQEESHGYPCYTRWLGDFEQVQCSSFQEQDPRGLVRLCLHEVTHDVLAPCRC
jgi:hypothetical protein